MFQSHRKAAQTAIEYAVLFAVFAVAAILMITYVKAGIRAKFKFVADEAWEGMTEKGEFCNELVTIRLTTCSSRISGRCGIRIGGNITWYNCFFDHNYESGEIFMACKDLWAIRGGCPGASISAAEWKRISGDPYNGFQSGKNYCYYIGYKGTCTYDCVPPCSGDFKACRRPCNPGLIHVVIQ